MGKFKKFPLKPGMAVTKEQKEQLIEAVRDVNTATPIVLRPNPMITFTGGVED